MLSVRGGKSALEFYVRAFGAEIYYRIEDPDGNVVARLGIGAAEWWIHDESENNPSPQTLGASTFRTVLTVDDPDALYARAIAAGATSVSGGLFDAHGWRTARIADPFGHHWEISKPL